VTAVAREEGQGSKGANYWGERKYLTEHSLMYLWEEGGWGTKSMQWREILEKAPVPCNPERCCVLCLGDYCFQSSQH